nr:olfactory receptor 43 [Gregopimpla kuwanae]
MSDLLRTYHLYDDTIRRLLIFTGLWPTANPGILYRLRTLAHGLSALVTSCAILNFCNHHSANLGLFLKGLGLAFSFITIIQKTICLTIYRHRLVEVHGTLASTFSQDLKDRKLQPIVLSPLLSFYRPSLMLSIVTYTVIVMYWITPPIVIAIQYSRGVDVIKYILPYPTRYPWTINGNSWLYPAHYILDVYAGICLGSFTSSIDSLFGYYVFQISGQLRTLSHRLTSIKSTENYGQVIRECAARHQILIRCQKNLECIYGPIVLWMLVTSAIIMCALIFQVSQMNPGKAVLVVVYIIMKSTQILLYGFFGTFLTNENDKFREAVYATDWAGSGKKCFMTDILIMVTYTPPILRACNLSNISVDMFVAMSNTAMSYFFMLRTLEENNEV